jgi:hypothetical protein
MAEQVVQETYREQDVFVPAKCVDCPFLDREFDPWSRITRLYCQAPWWHPKHWSCAVPPEVKKA